MRERVKTLTGHFSFVKEKQEMRSHLSSNSIINGMRIPSYFSEFFGFSAKMPTKIAASIPPSQAKILLFSPVFGRLAFFVAGVIVVGLDAELLWPTLAECLGTCDESWLFFGAS